MTDLELMIEVLKCSVEKHGEKPLTNKWLLNICRMAKRWGDEEEELEDQAYSYDPVWGQEVE